MYRERTSAALRIPSDEEGLALNDIRPVHGRRETRGKRAAWTYTCHIGAYGVLTSIAFAVDTTAARRAATENNFIAKLDCEEGPGGWEWEQTLEEFPVSDIYVTPVNLRTSDNKDPGHRAQNCHWSLMDALTFPARPMNRRRQRPGRSSGWYRNNDRICRLLF